MFLHFFARNCTKKLKMNSVNGFIVHNSFKSLSVLNAWSKTGKSICQCTQDCVSISSNLRKKSAKNIVQRSYTEYIKSSLYADISQMSKVFLSNSGLKHNRVRMINQKNVCMGANSRRKRNKNNGKRSSMALLTTDSKHQATALSKCTSENLVLKENKKLFDLKQLFPSPVSTLHEMYRTAFMKYNDKKFDLCARYEKINDSQWMCKYVMKWPDKTFAYIGSSKKEASYYAALLTLNYLKLYNKMKITKAELDINEKSSTQKIRPFNILNDLNLSVSSNNLTQVRTICTNTQLSTRSNVSRKKIEELPTTDKHYENVISEEMEYVRKLFPNAKNVLHNCFDLLAKDLKQADLKVTPTYKYSQALKTYTCTYHLKWPENIKFSKSGISKKESSYKAALSALNWLEKNDKINSFGQLKIFDKNKVKSIKATNVPTLNLKTGVAESLNSIQDLYKTKMKHYIDNFTENYFDNGNNLTNVEKLWPKNNKRFNQIFKGVEFYETQESLKLPISDYKENIIQTVNNNQVVIVKGEPGCGKSTRIPQYVLEGWAKTTNADNDNCRIIVTQPRRIAAISLAERVAAERNENIGNTVGYQVRLKSNFRKDTGRILYCTTGILLRRLQSDLSLSDCTHIILDEAHERDVNTDLLMNILKHTLKKNPELKLIVMSATIDANMFQEYFDQAPIVHIPGFTYPVKTHFLDSCKKINLSKTAKMCEGKEPNVVSQDVAKVIEYIHYNRGEGAILCFLPGWEDIRKINNLLPISRDLSVVCLHSRLQDSDQRKIFSKPPPGVRKVILSTNIAETSVTIDDVVYVIDTGVHKEERMDVEKGVKCIDNHWISQASMVQRKGRAGRVKPGESFHLYPKNKFNQFEEFSLPEIVRTSLTKIVLDSKVYSNNMNAVEFLTRLPTPPETNAVMKAVEELKELELLDENENLTSLGRTLSEFQLEPKLSKAMVNAVVFKCVTPIIDIVTMFSAETEIFATSLVDKESIRKSKRQYSNVSDHLSLMRLFEKWLEFIENGDRDMGEDFCFDYNLVEHKLRTLQKLRGIHFEYIYKGLKRVLPVSDDYSHNDEMVRGVLLSGVGTVLQRRNWDIIKGRLKTDNVLLTRHNQKATISQESVNSKRSTYPSDFLLYINETMSKIRRTTVIRETSLISPLTVILFKNNDLSIKEISETDYSDKIQSEDQVLLQLVGTKIEFICDRKQAELIQNCKTALQACLRYYLSQLTRGDDYNTEANKVWKDILDSLNIILDTEKL